MDYFISHLPITFFSFLIVAGCAILWWYLLDLNARLKKQRAEARRKAAEEARKAREAENKSE